MIFLFEACVESEHMTQKTYHIRVTNIALCVRETDLKVIFQFSTHLNSAECNFTNFFLFFFLSIYTHRHPHHQLSLGMSLRRLQ